MRIVEKCSVIVFHKERDIFWKLGKAESEVRHRIKGPAISLHGLKDYYFLNGAYYSKYETWEKEANELLRKLNEKGNL